MNTTVRGSAVALISRRLSSGSRATSHRVSRPVSPAQPNFAERAVTGGTVTFDMLRRQFRAGISDDSNCRAGRGSDSPAVADEFSSPFMATGRQPSR